MGGDKTDQHGKVPSFSRRLPSKIIASYFITSKGASDQNNGKLPAIAPEVAGQEVEEEEPELAGIVRKCVQQIKYIGIFSLTRRAYRCQDATVIGSQLTHLLLLLPVRPGLQGFAGFDAYLLPGWCVELPGQNKPQLRSAAAERRAGVHTTGKHTVLQRCS
jgi:hypothetical protein